ncbi:MAG: hypothetical protein NTV42_09675 [Chloroflexi bacterium]|nr:hypothetical protein [Chloroflexota bacterium]
MKYWYALSNEDIRTVADDLEVKINRAQIKKVQEIAPDYIDWFAAIEAAINVTLQKAEDFE